MPPDKAQQEAMASETSPAAGTTSINQSELTGQTISSRYLIEKELKRGGFGVVYLARDQQLHSRPVVIKVLLEAAFQNAWVVNKFRQEIEALSRIDHPGIVGVIDAGELPDGKPYLVMQYVDGVTLRSAITPEGMSFERAAALLRQIGRALAAAHDKGILHRDLKPENIMIQNLGHGEEQVKIIDFGIAKVRNSVLAPSTATTNVAGTIAYMAPEQLSARHVTAAADTYAVGSIAYELVTGRRPFNPETGFELLEMQRAGVRVKPIDLRPSLPEEAQEIILKTLSFEPRDRYQQARELGDALAQALAGEKETLEINREERVELPPTRLSTGVIPEARQTADPSSKTIVARFEPARAQTFDGSIYSPDPAPDDSHGKRSRMKIAAALIILIALAIGVSALIWKRGALFGKGETNANSAKSLSDRSLAYSLTVQKFHNGKAYDQPFETSGQEIFENGWKFRMNISSPQEGNLYLLNEGPAAGGATTYNMLFPEAKTNDGSSHVAADQKLQTAWMRFDDHQGTEKFWLVWSAAPVKELDAVTATVNERQKGEISDSDQAKGVRDFLEKNSSPKPEVEKDSAKKQTNVKGKGDVLVSFAELEHH